MTDCLDNMPERRGPSTVGKRQYRMRARADRVTDTRMRILTAARDMLAEGTFHDTSLEGMATRAGVTSGPSSRP